jgi:hypothetical protein
VIYGLWQFWLWGYGRITHKGVDELDHHMLADKGGGAAHHAIE